MFVVVRKMMSLTPSWLQNWETWANIFQSIATPILITIGGVFAWYKFIRQGKHDSRLQSFVTSEVVVREGVATLDLLPGGEQGAVAVQVQTRCSKASLA